MQIECVTPADLFFAKKLLPNETDESALFLISFLLGSIREGHLLIKKEGNTIYPKRAQNELIQKHLVDGFSKLEKLRPDIFSYDDNTLTLSSLNTLESEVAEHIMRLTKPNKSIHKEKALKQLDAISLTDEQKKASRTSIMNTCSCIYGGPGTGKTYTAAQFLRLFVDGFSFEHNPILRIALTGPTGKATRTLEQSIKNVVKELGPQVQIDVKTLHALLGKGRIFSKDRDATLSYSLIIVDEASMIDIKLMRDFLKRVPDTCSVLFLGDPDQLPPVEGGSPFSDMIDFHKKTGAVAFSELSVCKRTELQELLDFAKIVLQGDENSAKQFLLSNKTSIQFLQKDATDDDFQTILHDQRVCLTPNRNGPFSQNHINAQMKQISRKAKKIHDPIIITKNDYELDLMNGFLGELSNEFAYFPDRAPIPASLLLSYELAYAISIHKSQGSEFDAPVLFLPPGSELFGRKMLYTAITRAKKRLTIFSSMETLQRCIQTSSTRCTSLQEKLTIALRSKSQA